LDAALATFVRFGFRKTSMEEVARAAHLSRQGLYGHFATKEDLFRAAVAHALDDGLRSATAWLGGRHARVVGMGELGLGERLARAFDAWIGPFVGLTGADVTDLEEAGAELVGPLIAEHEARFVDAVTAVVKDSGLRKAYRVAGLSPRQLSETLYATARGLKYVCKTRAEFAERMGIAVRALCAPLGERR
jgi:AcrR family transcriptional regulator